MRFYFWQKQNEAKTFDFWTDSLKVRDSPLIHDSPKWILRAVALSMTINYRFVADLQGESQSK